ncbi:MAG TPA: response regulator transcription factor [Thermoanaerobaculia bacterium]|nr:response regulator transcription factor [Thermoanaerobaculia bacterium]
MSAQAPRVLVVEDEEAIAQGLVFNLERKGYVAELARDGREALERLSVPRYDLIVLDVRLPEVDGFEVCQRLRRDGDTTPILMLTARNQPDDVIYGLKLGADDYVTKPFDLAELLARVEGLLRRQAWSRKAAPSAEPGAAPHAGARYEFGEYWVDFDSYEAKTRGGVVQLPQKELQVMRLFASRPNQVVTRRELLTEVWGLPHHPNTRIVDNVIVALRQAFEESSTRPRHILSVRGVGYRFVP